MAYSPSDYTAREGVYLSRGQIARMRGAQALERQARHRAGELVARAEQEAQRLHRQAYSLGYEAGLLAAAPALLDHFTAVQALTERLQAQLAQRCHALLRSALDRPDVLLRALEEGLTALSGPPEMAVRIRLPAAARGLRPRVEAALQQAGRLAADIAYHDDARLVMLCGEQVFECDPPAQVAQAQRSLMAQFDDVPGQCAQLGRQAARQWRALLEQRYPALLADDNDDDDDDDDDDEHSGDENGADADRQIQTSPEHRMEDGFDDAVDTTEKNSYV